jgi:hypothetical protein
MAFPQPDFAQVQVGLNDTTNGLNTAVGGLTTFATEMQRIVNIPAIQDGNNLTATLARIENTLQDIRRDINCLDTKLDASNHNNLAFMTNTTVRHPSSTLMPFVHFRNGQPIPNFPATPADIVALSLVDINAILLALGEQANGTRPDKNTRLRTKVGLLSQNVVKGLY